MVLEQVAVPNSNCHSVLINTHNLKELCNLTLARGMLLQLVRKSRILDGSFVSRYDRHTSRQRGGTAFLIDTGRRRTFARSFGKGTRTAEAV